MSLLTIKDVTFQDFLDYPEIVVEAGKITFLTGASGSGKSTLLRLLNGVLSASAGVINYQGKNIVEYSAIQLRRELLLVSQAVYLFDSTIEENFKAFYEYRDEPLISRDKMKEYLAICAIDMPLDSDCQVLSGGERHRVFMAINLSFDAVVYMFDEPTSALDYQNAQLVMENITRFVKDRNKTLLIISHDKHLAEAYGDNIINLSKGQEEHPSE